MKRLLLAGGGHAHVHVLQDFARQRPAGAELTLVTPFPRQMYSGMVPGLVAGHYGERDCVIPLGPLAKAAGVRLIESRVVGLDAAARRATLADGSTFDYDLLSLDTGPEVDRGAIPGAREHALFVRPIEHFVPLLGRLLDLAARQPLDVVVVGAGAAGVELALALRWRLSRLADGSKHAHAVSLAGDEALPLPGFTPAVRRRALKALRRAGVTFLTSPAVEVSATHVLLANGARVACRAPVVAIGATAPTWLRGSGLALDERGFVATGPTLQSNSHPEVFAAGDVATRTDHPHPKSGVYAVRAGPPLAANLRAAAAGGALVTYTPQPRTLYLLSLGRKAAIGSWGRWATAGAWVWWWKDRIDRAFIARHTAASDGGTTPA